MNPVKNVKELGQQLPDLLLGAQDFPSLIIDSLNGLKNQSAWQDRQLREIQQLRLQMEHQQRRSWMFGSTMLILLTIAIISPWFVSIILIVLSSLLALLAYIEISSKSLASARDFLWKNLIFKNL